ncbi:MAG: carboxypeptidase regulatory-like domain-containing protein, partial [Bifidobacteriaceae bacterium]|nr:carboxypeptidase regulatory-like domain-containing protein [Bifidobacteriaceae bacterium]
EDGDIWTDDEGYFIVDGLGRATFAVQIGGGDWESVFAGGGAAVFDAEQYFVDGSIEYTGSHTLLPANTISGSVTDSSGTPVSGVPIRAERVGDDVEDSSIEFIAGAAATDAYGTFVLDGLAAGEYMVHALDGTDFLDSALTGSAPIIQIGGGQDAVLQSPVVICAPSSIAGTVTGGSNGLSLSGVWVQASVWSEDGEDWVPAGASETGANGTFTLPRLGPGSYRVDVAGINGYLSARVPPSDGDPLIEVEEGETITLPGAVNLSLGGTVEGSVTAATTGSVLPGLQVTAFLRVFDEVGNAEWQAQASAVTASDGTYSIEGLPAGAAIVFVDGGADYVSRYSDGESYEEDAEPIDVAEGDVLNMGTVALGNAAQLSGQAVDSFGAAIAGAPVMVYSVLGGEGELVTAAQTDSTGQYEVGGLEPGDYVVEVVPIHPDASDSVPDSVILPETSVEAGDNEQLAMAVAEGSK